MNKVLILGAGLVTRPAVHYLLKKGYHVTVASRTVSKAENLVQGFQNGKALALLADDNNALEALVKDHDLTVSLLPYSYHVQIAKLCLKHKKHLVTTSYVSKAMKELDSEAKKVGVLLLNEIGLDPGIDHMSAMRIIHNVKENGGKVTSFRSWCGGLPAPDANDNPWGYKFSWSPRGVVMAGKNASRYQEKGKLIEIPGPDLFAHHWVIDVEDKEVGLLEGYPNRDCMGYIELYGLEGISTMFRGTLRYEGWCDSMKKLVDIGYLDETEINTKGMTYGGFLDKLINDGKTGDRKKRLAAKLGVSVEHNIINRWEWLGLLSDDPINHDKRCPLDILADKLLEKLQYKSGERDLIVLFHEFGAEYPNKKERITSTLIGYGIPNGDTAMARTVSLPAAVAIRLVFENKIKVNGVYIPNIPEIYNPVLDELETLDIICKEKYTTL